MKAASSPGAGLRRRLGRSFIGSRRVVVLEQAAIGGEPVQQARIAQAGVGTKALQAQTYGRLAWIATAARVSGSGGRSREPLELVGDASGEGRRQFEWGRIHQGVTGLRS